MDQKKLLSLVAPRDGATAAIPDKMPQAFVLGAFAVTDSNLNKK